MFSTRLLVLLSICCCLVATAEEVVIRKGNKDTDDLFKTFQQAFSPKLDPHPNDFQAEEVDQVHGYPNASIGNIVITGQTNDYGHSFYGIPYAEPPIGDLRFMAPVEKKFQDDISAYEPSRVRCIQSSTSNSQSEDCLVLNIHTPSSVDAESFATQQFDQLVPVMFYIHGGKYSVGSGTSKQFDGRFLSDSTNTVVVTINYRLGALGFLVLEEDGVKFNGNQGHKDQQLALKWVYDHIQNFGGDPGQITIFGVSAGAQSVMLHLASKVSKPYFKRCIMESNVAVYHFPTVDEAKEISDALVEVLDCGKNYDSNVECLRDVDPKMIVSKTKIVGEMALDEGDYQSSVETFRPVVDGDEFPNQPLVMFRDGNWNKEVDVIIGTNREESADVSIKYYNQTIPLEIFKVFNLIAVGDELGPTVTAEYLKLVSNPGEDTDYTPIIAQEYGDLYWICPSRALARFISKTSTSGNVYLYSWNFTSCDDPTQRCSYACHTCETSYVFNTRSYTGQSNGVEEQAISAMFSDFWGSFAYSGVPTSADHDTWLKYEALTEGNAVNWEDIYMIYPRSTMEENYMKDLCDFWDSLDFYVEMDPSDNGSTKSMTSLSLLLFLLSFVVLIL